MLVKELIEQEKGKYDKVFVIDTRNIVFPSKYLDYEVVDYYYYEAEGQRFHITTKGLKMDQPKMSKTLYITGKKVGLK